MNKNKLTRISGVSDRITSTISVALVLFILDLVAPKYAGSVAVSGM